MKAEDIKTGQIWKRENGAYVTIGCSRMFRCSIEWQLIPTLAGAKKGRKFWKWDGGIINELTYVGN